MSILKKIYLKSSISNGNPSKLFVNPLNPKNEININIIMLKNEIPIELIKLIL